MEYYLGWEMMWQGRSLMEIVLPNKVFSYTYTPDGIRNSKTVNGTKTEYLLNGTQILAQKTGSDVMWFFYDSTGARVGIQDGDVTAYYMYNLQGDVIGLADAATGKVIAKYLYDAWGKCISVENASGYTIGTDNPFRYRGYYYDTETGFYYLNSRYYNPEVGRFLNIDNQLNGSLLGNNLFAYCDNNPVKYSDYTGESLTIAIAAATFGELLFGVSVTAVFAKMIYDTATDIVDLLHSKGDAENKGSKSSEKEGTVTSKNPPTEDDGYQPPKGGPKTGKTKSGKKGWVDDKGNVWVPAPTGSREAHGGGHWDVNRKDGRGYINIYPGGNMRPGRGIPPVLQIIKIFDER